MKSTLEFNLPEEKTELVDALNGTSYNIVINQFDNWLRQLYKYENKRTVDIELARQKLRELTDEYCIEVV